MNPATPQSVRALGDFISLIQLAVSDKGLKALVDKAAETLEEAKTIRDQAISQAEQNRKDQVAIDQGFSKLDEQKENFLAAKAKAEKKTTSALEDAEALKKQLTVDIASQLSDLEAREKVVNDRDHFLNGREKEINEQEIALEAKKADIYKRERELEEKLENIRKAAA